MLLPPVLGWRSTLKSPYADFCLRKQGPESFVHEYRPRRAGFCKNKHKMVFTWKLSHLTDVESVTLCLSSVRLRSRAAVRGAGPSAPRALTHSGPCLLKEKRQKLSEKWPHREGLAVWELSGEAAAERNVPSRPP